MLSIWSKTLFHQPRAFALIRLVVLNLFFIFLASFPGEAASGWNWYFVDTHLHSSVSADAFVDIGIISQVAKTTGYSALFLTDHNGASNFQINNITANHNAFDDTFLRWDPADFGDPLTTRVNSLASSPVNTGTQSWHLVAGSSGYGETYLWSKRGPNFRAGDILLNVSVYPIRIDSGSSVYFSASIGGDLTVNKNPRGYTTQAGVITPRKTTVLVWQLGNARAASSDPNARVIVFPLTYQLNHWNHYTINVSQAMLNIPAADRPLDYDALTYLKVTALGNGGTANAYFDTYSIDASAPPTSAQEFVYRNSVIGNFNTSTFTIFPALEMGQQRHAIRYNFGITNPTDFRNYTFGTDGIADTQATGYPAQLNHPGETETVAEVLQNQGYGADFVEVRHQPWIDVWDTLLQQGVHMLGIWSTDSHAADLSAAPATYLYAPSSTLDDLIHSLYEGRTYNAITTFGGRALFNLNPTSQEPYPARYPVYVSDAATSANLHLNVTGGLTSDNSVIWIRNGSPIITETTAGSSYDVTKAISLAGASTYIRTETLTSTGIIKTMTQPIFFLDVPTLPAGMSFHVDGITTPNARDYTRVATKGITTATWNTSSQFLTLTLQDPVNSLINLQMVTNTSPQQIEVNSTVIAKTGTKSTFDSATNSIWYYDSAAQILYLKVKQLTSSTNAQVEFGSGGDTQPPTTPTNLSATPISAGEVDLAWSASTDNTSVSGYTLYRDGQTLNTVAGNVLSYVDTNVVPGTTYTYTVDASDPAQNHSAQSGPASATVPTQGSLTFPAVVDSYVDASNPNTNYGNLIALRTDASPVINSYLRFNLQGISGTVTHATLRIFVNTASAIKYDVRGVANTTWGETTITSGNAPAMGSIVGSSGVPISANSWTSVDVTSLVSGNGLLSLALSSPNNTGVSYSSRTGANPPQLVVVVGTQATPTPTPTPTATSSPPQSFNPVADTWVSAASPTTNFGTSISLQTDNSPIVNSYLRFNVQNLSGVVVSATLRIFANTASNGGLSVRSVADNTWNETTTNYDNAPTLGSIIASPGGFSASSWIVVDVTPQVSGNGLVSFALTSTSATATSFSSEQGANKPQLLIQTAPQGRAALRQSNMVISEPTLSTTSTVSPTATDSLTMTLTNTFTALPTDTATSTASLMLTDTATDTPAPLPLPSRTSVDSTNQDSLIESDTEGVARSAGWNTMTQPAGASGGSYLLNSAPDDSLSIVFQGTQIAIKYVQGPSFGSFAVELDGAIVQQVNSYAPLYEFNDQFTLSSLGPGQHRLRILAAQGVIAIDAFILQAGPEVTSEIDSPTAMASTPVDTEILPSTTATPTFEPDGTSTPIALIPPLSADMNDGATDWQATTGWRLTSDAAYKGAGMSWQLMPSSATESLRWTSAIDLRTLLPSKSVQLSFASNLQLISGTARVEVSLDGGHQWLVAAVVTPSDNWGSQVVDVSAFAGHILQLQFVWIPDLTTSSNEAVTHWGLDQVSLQSVEPITVTPSSTVSDSLATTEAAAPTEAITPVTSTPTATVAEPATDSAPATVTPMEMATATATPTFMATVTLTPTETATQTVTLADLPAVTSAP